MWWRGRAGSGYHQRPVLGLVRTLLMLGFTMLVVVQWSDLNSAFSFLSSIEVWRVSSKVAGIEQLSAITLQDLMLTVFAFILTVVTARNLPGLMGSPCSST